MGFRALAHINIEENKPKQQRSDTRNIKRHDRQEEDQQTSNS